MNSLKIELQRLSTRTRVFPMTKDVITRAELFMRAAALDNDEKESVSAMVFEFNNADKTTHFLCFPKDKPFKEITKDDLGAHAKDIFDFCEKEGLKPTLTYKRAAKEEDDKIEIWAHWGN